jgi:signal transduction histidine kinase
VAITRWVEAARRRPLDVVLLVVIVLVQLDLLGEVGRLIPALAAGVSGLVLLARRRTPYISIATSFAGQLVVLLVLTKEPTAVFGQFLLTFVVAGGLRPEAAAWVGWAAGLGVIALSERGPNGPGPGISDFLVTAAFCSALFGLALLVTRRSHAHAAATTRADNAEADNERAAAQAATRERTRIAREMHDVVAHSLTVAVVQCVAALDDIDRGDAGHETVRRRVAAAEDSCRDALDELRRMLGVLRFAPEQLEPTPQLSGLDLLADSIREAGVHVDVHLCGAVAGLPPGIELTCYRIVQEALTNVLKHAQATCADVTVSCEPTQVTVRVVDDGGGSVSAQSSGGQGLIGMRERAAAYAGTLFTGPGPHGGYLVEAVIPFGGNP